MRHSFTTALLLASLATTASAQLMQPVDEYEALANLFVPTYSISTQPIVLAP